VGSINSAGIGDGFSMIASTIGACVRRRRNPVR